MNVVRILVVEDDRRLAELLRRGLSESGHVVDLEYDGESAEGVATHGRYDAIVLDVMLPGKDGISLTQALRARALRTPILMLTARDTVSDTIAGLDAGADDYLRKPFVFEELEARLRSIARREPTAPKSELRSGELVMDLATRRVAWGGRSIEFTAREIAFLEFFMRNAGLLVTREMLENALWERDRDTVSNVIEVYVRRLRAKLASVGAPSLIRTVRGAGYRFAASDA
jgi:DNA-binding response OmpR family regulator